MTNGVRFGLIGCGGHGRLLAGALAQVPGATLVACCDANPAAAAALPGEQLARFTDYHKMLEQAAIDAVIVVTSHTGLAAATTAVVESGRHAFCEKPMAVSADQARPGVAAARRAGVNLMVGYCLRYDALRRQMKELLAAGAVGKVAYVMAGKGGGPHTGWMADRAAGGGQLLWVGSHLVDQVLWMVGKPAERVYAEMERRPDGDTDDTSVFTVRFEGGILAHLDCSQAAHASYDFVEVVGAKGRVRADWLPQPLLRVYSDVIPAYNGVTTIAPFKYDRSEMYVSELREFVASILEKRAPATTGDDGLRALEVLDAVVASAESGAPILLTEPMAIAR